MRQRGRTTAFFAVISLLFIAASGYTKTAAAPSKTSSEAIGVKQNAQTEPESASGEAYIVQKGDSLFKIAREHQTTAKALKAANGLKGSKIKIGQKLIIPGSSTAKTVRTPAKPKTKSARNEQMVAQYISQLRSQNQVSDLESPPMRMRLVEAGFQMLGVRYRRSGGSEKTGFDCSGLVKSLFSQFNIDLPRSSREQFKQGEKIDRDKLEVGDLVFFSSGGSRPTHVGIYVGEDKFLHAAVKAGKVIVSDLNKFWYSMRYLGARRIANLWWDETETTPDQN